MKKFAFLKLLTVLVTALLVITACQAPSPVEVTVEIVKEVEVTKEVEVAAANEPQQLTVSFPGDGRVATMENIIDSFVAKKAAEGVLVDIQMNQPTEGYYDQVLLDFSAGVGPDVFSVSGEGIPEFVSADYMMPLDDMLAGWDEYSNFPDGMKEMPAYNGSTYAVMYDTDTRLVYYRNDVFEAAGIELPWNPTSWEDIFAASRQIRDNTENVIPLEVQSGTIWGEATTIGGFFMLLRGTNDVLLDTSDNKWIVESPGIEAAFKFYEDMFAEGLSEADLFMEAEPWVPYLQEGFRDGNVGIIVSGSWMWGLYAPDSEWAPIPDRDEVVSWAPMPAMEPGAGLGGRDFVGMGGGWGWSMAKNSANPELAWEFIQFMSSADSITRYVNDMGSIPARSDAVSDEAFFNELATSVLPYQSFRPASPQYNQVSAEIQVATERMMLGEANATEAMKMFAEAVEAAVGAENVKRITE